MTTINLYQNQEESQKMSERTANGGFWFSLSILVMTLLALFGLKFYVARKVAENTAIRDEITQQNQSLTGINSLKHVVDIQTRLSEISKNLQITDKKIGRTKMTDVLTDLGSAMNSGVAVSSYEYASDGKLKVTFESHNFNDSARQLLNLKKSTEFSNVTLDSIARGEKNVTSVISMKIKGEDSKQNKL